ncbi:MAG: hypothetical protein R2789_11165 [Microthrixaceae bacterium]
MTMADPFDGFVGNAEVYLKRDDQSGLGLGGGKLRKLEFILGGAVASGCDTLVTFGAISPTMPASPPRPAPASDWTATWCSPVGCPAPTTCTTAGGNVLLDELFGATLWHAGSTEQGLQDDRPAGTAGSTATGPEVHGPPPAASRLSGLLGYVVSAHELSTQCEQHPAEPEAVFVASSHRRYPGRSSAGPSLHQEPGAPGSGTRIEGMAVTSRYRRPSMP